MFYWSLFVKVQFIIFQIGLDNGLVSNKQQAIIWIKGGLVYGCIYASLGLNVLVNMQPNHVICQPIGLMLFTH